MTLEITSSSFEQGQNIPQKHTCIGNDVSPQIAWNGAPEGVESYAIIADDPDAPMGTWVHWVVYNIPADVNELQENFPKDEKLDNGIMQGMSDFGKTEYGGPCPPGGTHRYYFKVYAIDKKLDAEPGLSKKKLLKAMEGHILAEGQLMGKFSK